MLKYFLRFPILLCVPALLLIVVGCVIAEILFGVELCPLRDAVLRLAGMSYGHDHACEHSHD